MKYNGPCADTAGSAGEGLRKKGGTPMRKRNKVVSLLLAGCMAAGLLAGCGSSGGSSSSSGGGKSGSTSDMIVTTMYTEAGSLDSAGESGLWWWSYDDVLVSR